MSCKDCNNKQETTNEYGNPIAICTIDGHEVRELIESCENDTNI